MCDFSFQWKSTFPAHIQSSEFILFVTYGISNMGGKTAKNGNSVSDNQEWKVLGWWKY